MQVERSIVDRVGDVARPRDKPAATAVPYGLPGERGLVAGIANVAGVIRRGIDHFADQQRRYGSIYQTRIGLQPIICVHDPELIAQIARNDDEVWSAALAYRAMFDGLEPAGVSLDGPGSLDFAPHRDARRLLAAAFTPAALASYLERARGLFEAAIAVWCRRGRVAFKREARALFATAAVRMFVGLDDPADVALFDRDIAAVWRTPSVLWHDRRFGPGMRRAVSALDRLKQALHRLIPERRASDRVDLFSRMCREAPQLPWIDDATLVRMFVGVMLAVFDTTAAGITSMAYLLAREPTWQDRLRRECAQLAADEVTRDALRALDQVGWAWKETLRLYPVVPGMPRCALRPVVLGGHRLPAGTTVLAIAGTAMRDPRYWREPERFDPERFSPERGEDRGGRGIYLPFGAGAHACVGMQLATVEAKAFFHALLGRARIGLASERPVHHEFNTLGMVSGPVELTVSRR